MTERGDGSYHCLNRADENPFSEAVKMDKNETSWLQLVNTPCSIDDIVHPHDYVRDDVYRRCLGSKPEQCIYPRCKF